MIILFFGQPASGKTTLAQEFKQAQVIPSTFPHIDGDKWRDITKNKNYTKDGRIANLKGAFDMALYLEKEKYTPILSFVTPYEELRQYLIDNAKSCKLIHLYYNEERGRTHLFAKDFEVPTNCLSIDTSYYNINECLEKIDKYTKE